MMGTDDVHRWRFVSNWDANFFDLEFPFDDEQPGPVNPYCMLDVDSLSKCGELVAGTSYTEFKDEDTLDSTESSRKRVFDKPCAVCGGQASGYHYETPSCNSCKTFFRRTVISGKTYKCIKGDGKCLMLDKIVIKIKCRQCRYERCIKEGMRPETVSTKDGPTLVKIEPSVSPSGSDGDCSTPALSDYNAGPTIDPMKYARCVAALGDIEDKISALRNTDFDPYAEEIGLLYLLERGSLLDYVHNFKTVTNWLTHPRISPSRGPCRDSPSCRDLPEWLALDLICSVEYMKRFALFNAMPVPCRIEVIQRCGLSMAIAMHCFNSYLNGHEMITFPDGTSPVHFLPNFLYDGRLFQQQFDVFVKVIEPWKREKIEKNEYLLLKAIILHETMHKVLEAEETSHDLNQYIRYTLETMRLKVGNKGPSRMMSLLGVFQSLIQVSSKHRNHMLASESIDGKSNDKMVREVIFREVPTSTLFVTRPPAFLVPRVGLS